MSDLNVTFILVFSVYGQTKHQRDFFDLYRPQQLPSVRRAAALIML